MTPHCIWAAGAELGESPVWHAEDQVVYWVDIANARLYRLDLLTEQQSQTDLPFAATCLVAAGAGRLIAASASGMYELDTRTWSVGRRIGPGTGPGIRTNDGACDPWGNFWYGTMDLLEHKPLGRIYRLAVNGSTRDVWGRCAITNGPAFDLDRKLVFATDTLARRIYRARVDESGLADEFKAFHQFDEHDGYPDGMALDDQGCLWCAMWAGRKVVRLSPSGSVLASLSLPVSNPTSCAFGGADGATLFVTSARKKLDAEQLTAEPLAGGLFAIATDVRGARVASFGGAWGDKT